METYYWNNYSYNRNFAMTPSDKYTKLFPPETYVSSWEFNLRFTTHVGNFWKFSRVISCINEFREHKSPHSSAACRRRRWILVVKVMRYKEQNPSKSISNRKHEVRRHRKQMEILIVTVRILIEVFCIWNISSIKYLQLNSGRACFLRLRRISKVLMSRNICEGAF